MKKLVYALMGVCLLSGVSFAQPWPHWNQIDASLDGKQAQAEAQLKAAEKAVVEQALEDAKFDFAGLPEDFRKSMKEAIKEKYPKEKYPEGFDHAAFIGQVDLYFANSYASANSYEEKLYTYYFVVTTGDTDDFYVGIRKETVSSRSFFRAKKTSGLVETIYMGTAAHDNTLNYKEALASFMKGLPVPFNQHATALLRGVPFTTINSIEIVKQESFQNVIAGKMVTTTEYRVQYNQKDGNSFQQTFIYKPVIKKYEGTWGDEHGEKVEKI